MGAKLNNFELQETMKTLKVSKVFTWMYDYLILVVKTWTKLRSLEKGIQEK